MLRTVPLFLALLLAGCTALPAPLAERLALFEAEPRAPASGTLRVHVVDVGQGDAVVWEWPGGDLAVLDCGPPAPSAGANPLVAFLRDRLGRAPGSALAALVASHGHLDHIGGCEELLDAYAVNHIYEAWYDGGDAPASYRRFLEQAATEGALLHTVAPGPAGALRVAAGEALAVSESARAAGVRAELLWPRDLVGIDWDGIAERGLVVRLAFGNATACFQGDIEVAQELALAQAPGNVTCDLYLVGHHGSARASSQRWLERMQPSVAAVSFGANSYGHPTSQALCRVQQAGAAVYATHRAGTLTFTTTGEAWTVEPALPETKDYCAAGAAYWP